MAGRKKVIKSVGKVSIKHNKPVYELSKYTVVIYGPPKIGKTTLASSWPKPIFLAPEKRGISALEVDFIPIGSWGQLLASIRLLSKKDMKKKYDTVIVDTADLLWKLCLVYCGQKFGFEHPSDQGWGKGWEKVADEFQEAVLGIFDLGYAVVFISHERETEMSEDWETYTKISPSLPTTGRRVILPLVDIILYMSARPDKKTKKPIRRVSTKAVREYEAGDRTHCLTDKIIKLPESKQFKGYSVINNVFRKSAGK